MTNLTNEVVIFEDGELKLEVNVTPSSNTVWLSQAQMERLFDVKQNTISGHIKNIFSEKEVDEVTSIGFSDRSSGGRKPKIYNLDVIISVGYRVNSKRGVLFRQWATNILKEYMIQGYSLNEKRLEVLQKTIDIQSSMLAHALDLDTKDVLKVVNEYSKALSLLDDYDHQSVTKPEGNQAIHQLTYQESRLLIDNMNYGKNSEVFGVEKEKGKLNGILEAVHQHVYGQELYPTLEEKASNLLYFLIKDHPFADGCKRIGATLFLEFLDKNNALYKPNGQSVISESALVAITLMVAESNPKEKDIMVHLIMNFLQI